MADSSPKVRFQPCQVWTAAADPSAGVCAECGWFEEDHWMAEQERRAEPVGSPA